MPDTLAVLGAGSWGTALATLAARNGLATTLWGRDAAIVEAIDRGHQNPRYLPGIELPASLRAPSPPLRAAATLRAARCIRRGTVRPVGLTLVTHQRRELMDVVTRPPVPLRHPACEDTQAWTAPSRSVD